MNLFNRVVTLMVVLATWLAIVLLAAVPNQWLAWTRAGLDWVEQSLLGLAAMQPSWLYLLLRVGVIGLSTLVLAALLWLELRRRRTPVARVQVPVGGQAAVTADSVARRLAWHIDQLADVISVRPMVQTRGGVLDVHLSLETAPEVDVPMKTEEVMVVAREVIEQQMGLQLRKLQVEIQHAPYPADLEWR
jgi:hypothetical protein